MQGWRPNSREDFRVAFQVREVQCLSRQIVLGGKRHQEGGYMRERLWELTPMVKALFRTLILNRRIQFFSEIPMQQQLQAHCLIGPGPSAESNMELLV